MLCLLILAYFSENIINEYRDNGDYIVVQNVDVTNINDESVKKKECSFIIDKIEHAETFAFFVIHQNVEVYFGDECVYTLTAKSDDSFSTPGGKWVVIPIYDSDFGKEIRVVLTPIYEDYNSIPDFYLGSQIAIHNTTLHNALPGLMLSLCVAFVGFLLICLAVYHSVNGMSNYRLYAMGLMALSSGVWRITYDRVIYLLTDDSVLIYNISVVCLMCMALSMINTLGENKTNSKFVRITSVIYCVVYTLQLIMQIFGISDLRLTLKIIHLTIIVSAIAFLADGIKQVVMYKRKKGVKFNFA